jgi:hypothetical protein
MALVKEFCGLCFGSGSRNSPDSYRPPRGWYLREFHSSVVLEEYRRRDGENVDATEEEARSIPRPN